MVVVPNPPNLIDCPQELKKLIFTSNNLEKNISENLPIFSFSQEIEAIDPLIFFSVMQDENQVSFYWHNKRKKEAMIAIGAIKILNIISEDEKVYENKQRFQSCQQFINDQQKNINFIDDKLNYNQACFFSYFSFFAKNNNHNYFPSSSIFLPYIQLSKQEEKYILTINTYRDIDLIKEYINNHNFSQQLKISYYQPNNANKSNDNNQGRTNYDIDERQYHSFLDKVNQGLQAIATKKLTKIVVAHALEVKKRENFNLIKSLENLRENHPDCYIFAIGNQQQEYFIGASPERLLSIKQKQIVSDALAGSAPRGKEQEEDLIIGIQLLQGEKEKREHQVVSDFIYSQLQKMNLSPKKASLQLLKLSNIQHLWTPIHAQINDHIHPLEIISELHPTPAVAGEPMEIACQEIEKSEKFERSLYASPIGWINTNGDCEFIVGIRSAFIKQNQAILYAGAGIVAGSQPEQELIEIKLKFQALLQALT
jgi:menaquinone-specific isochorismate synthase